MIRSHLFNHVGPLSFSTIILHYHSPLSFSTIILHYHSPLSFSTIILHYHSPLSFSTIILHYHSPLSIYIDHLPTLANRIHPSYRLIHPSYSIPLLAVSGLHPPCIRPASSGLITRQLESISGRTFNIDHITSSPLPFAFSYHSVSTVEQSNLVWPLSGLLLPG